MVLLSRKFSAPTAIDKAQWKKVEFLVAHGFVFQTVYETPRGGRSVRYPATLDEAKGFVVEFADQAVRGAA
jgi:hypothetical protein